MNGPRTEGANPRAKGTNPRAKGTNPRATDPERIARAFARREAAAARTRAYERRRAAEAADLAGRLGPYATPELRAAARAHQLITDTLADQAGVIRGPDL